MIGRARRPVDHLLASAPQARRTSDVAVALGVLAAASTLGFAFLLATAIARVFIGGESLGDVVGILLLAALLALARGGLVAVGEVVGQRAAGLLGSAVRRSLLERLVTLGPAWSSGERVGEIVRTMTSGLDALEDWISGYRPARLLAAIVPLLVLVVVAVLDPPTGLVLVLTGPVLVLLLAVIGGRAHGISRRRFAELRWMGAFFVDMLRGIATLKAFGRSAEQAASIREISGRLGDTTMDVLRTAFQTALVLEWAAAVATAVVATEVSLRLMAGAVPFETAIAVLVITPEFFLPLRTLAIRYHSGSAGDAAAERLLAIRDAVAPTAPRPASPRPVAASTGRRAVAPSIAFDDVWFAYPDRSPALRGLTLEVGSGELVALVGPSGAGKTTIAHLLLGFDEPDRGTIRVDGAALEALDRAHWLRSIAWVPQRPHLPWGTVADAIRSGRRDATAVEVAEAARVAGADGFIRELPQGYDTHLGEGGRRLSGGQRQRLALARAFVRDASLVILDEATSHLDVASEAAVADALRTWAAGRTVLVIAHRARLAAIADRVVTIDGGRVAGSPVPA